MLKLKSMGFPLGEVVKELAEKYQISTRSLYYDFKNRKTWMEALLGIDDPKAFFVDLLSNHQEIYRLTSLEFLKADNSNARIGALKLLRDLNKDFVELLFFQSLDKRVGKLEAAS